MVAEKAHDHSWNLQKAHYLSLQGWCLCASQCEFLAMLCFLVYLLSLKIYLDDHLSWNDPISISIFVQNSTAQPHKFWCLIFAFAGLKILRWLGSLNLIFSLFFKKERCFLCENTVEWAKQRISIFDGKTFVSLLLLLFIVLNSL